MLDKNVEVERHDVACMVCKQGTQQVSLRSEKVAEGQLCF